MSRRMDRRNNAQNLISAIIAVGLALVFADALWHFMNELALCIATAITIGLLSLEITRRRRLP